MNQIINQNSLFLAPLDGLTDGHFRHFFYHDFAGFDYYMSEFLRIPSDVPIRDSFIIDTIGDLVFYDEEIKEKNILQILVSPRSAIEESVKKIANLGIKWLDLNCGCPSKTVVKNKGGSYLLTDYLSFEESLKRIRDHYPYKFSIKIRLGVDDPHEVFNLLPIMTRVGVDSVFIHGRTVAMKYNGESDWEIIKKVKNHLSIPVIGNGDILRSSDIRERFLEAKTDGVMIGRGVLRSPWIAKEYRGQVEIKNPYIERFSFLNRYAHYLMAKGLKEDVFLKKLKGISCYLFTKEEALPLLRSQKIEQFFKVILEVV